MHLWPPLAGRWRALSFFSFYRLPLLSRKQPPAVFLWGWLGLTARQPQRKTSGGCLRVRKWPAVKRESGKWGKSPPPPAPGRLPGHSQGGRAAGTAWDAPWPCDWSRSQRRACGLLLRTGIRMGCGRTPSGPQCLSPAAAGFAVHPRRGRGGITFGFSALARTEILCGNAKPRGARGDAKLMFWRG